MATETELGKLGKSLLVAKLLERTPDHTLPELLGMAFESGSFTPAERELIEQTAPLLKASDHESLALVAASATLTILKLRSIIANLLHVFYHLEKTQSQLETKQLEALSQHARTQEEIADDFGRTLIAMVKRARARRQAGGKTTGALKKADAARRHAQWMALARKLRESGHTDREIPGIVARRFGVTPPAVRAALKKKKAN